MATNEQQENQEHPSGWHKPEKKETLPEVVAKIDALRAELSKYEKLAFELKEAERQEAIAQTRNLMRAHGLSLQDIGSNGLVVKKSSTAGTKAPVKYRDKTTGNVWTGRGLKPKWLQAALNSGRKLEEFQV